MEEKYELYLGDCLEVMKTFEPNIIDLTVTSPPYDNLRTYEGSLNDWTFEKFQEIAKELFRITKEGGVVVWVVGDATINGSETGTSFKQALYFKEIGFNLHDTMIWEKTGRGSVGSKYCYWQNFEYMFIFSIGRPKSFNPICDRYNRRAGEKTTTGHRNKYGTYKREIVTKPFGRRFNNWRINQETKQEHPAPFPEQLANDHIVSWSNEDDIIFDPFLGSGTTGKMAILNNRKFIGIERVNKYFEISKKRIEEVEKEKSRSIF